MSPGRALLLSYLYGGVVLTFQVLSPPACPASTELFSELHFVGRAAVVARWPGPLGPARCCYAVCDV